MATFRFIKAGDLTVSMRLAKQLLSDPHDLMHKAVGWMLREVGKKSLPTLRIFLRQYASQMPRTMLRYSIEKLSDTERVFFLAKPRNK